MASVERARLTTSASTRIPSILGREPLQSADLCPPPLCGASQPYNLPPHASTHCSALSGERISHPQIPRLQVPPTALGPRRGRRHFDPFPPLAPWRLPAVRKNYSRAIRLLSYGREAQQRLCRRTFARVEGQARRESVAEAGGVARGHRGEARGEELVLLQHLQPFRWR